MTTTEFDEGHKVQNAEAAMRQDVAEAEAALGQISGFMKSFKNVDALVRMLQGRVQLMSELDAAVAKRRAELKALDEHTTEAAAQAGQQRANHVIAEAQRKASNIISEAADKAAGIDKATDEKRAELAEIESKIEAAKNTLRQFVQ